MKNSIPPITKICLIGILVFTILPHVPLNAVSPVENYRDTLIGKSGEGGEIEKFGKLLKTPISAATPGAVEKLMPTDSMKTTTTMIKNGVKAFIDNAYDPAWKLDKTQLHQHATFMFDAVQYYFDTLAFVAQKLKEPKNATNGLEKIVSELQNQYKNLAPQLKDAWKWGKPKHLRMIFEVLVALNRAVANAIQKSADALAQLGTPIAPRQQPGPRIPQKPTPQLPPSQDMDDDEKYVEPAESTEDQKRILREREKLEKEQNRRNVEKKLAQEREQQKERQQRLQNLTEMGGTYGGIPIALRLFEIGSFQRLLSASQMYTQDPKENKQELSKRTEEARYALSTIYDIVKALAAATHPRFDPNKFDAVTADIFKAIDIVQGPRDVLAVVNMHVALCLVVLQRFVIFSPQLEAHLVAYRDDAKRIEALLKKPLDSVGQPDFVGMLLQEVNGIRTKFAQTKQALLKENLEPDTELKNRLLLIFSRPVTLYKNETPIEYKTLDQMIETLRTETDTAYRSQVAQTILRMLLNNVNNISDPVIYVRAHTQRTIGTMPSISSDNRSFDRLIPSFKQELETLASTMLGAPTPTQMDNMRKILPRMPSLVDLIKDSLLKRTGLGAHDIAGDILTPLLKANKELDDTLTPLNTDLTELIKSIEQAVEGMMEMVKTTVSEPLGGVTATTKKQVTQVLGALATSITHLTKEPAKDAGLIAQFAAKQIGTIIRERTEGTPLFLVDQLKTSTKSVIESLVTLQKRIDRLPQNPGLTKTLKSIHTMIGIVQRNINTIKEKKTTLLNSVQETLIKLVAQRLSILTTQEDKRVLVKDILEAQVVNIPEIMRIMAS